MSPTGNYARPEYLSAQQRWSSSPYTGATQSHHLQHQYSDTGPTPYTARTAGQSSENRYPGTSATGIGDLATAASAAAEMETSAEAEANALSRALGVSRPSGASQQYPSSAATWYGQGYGADGSFGGERTKSVGHAAPQQSTYNQESTLQSHMQQPQQQSSHYQQAVQRSPQYPAATMAQQQHTQQSRSQTTGSPDMYPHSNRTTPPTPSTGVGSTTYPTSGRTASSGYYKPSPPQTAQTISLSQHRQQNGQPEQSHRSYAQQQDLPRHPQHGYSHSSAPVRRVPTPTQAAQAQHEQSQQSQQNYYAQAPTNRVPTPTQAAQVQHQELPDRSQQDYPYSNAVPATRISTPKQTAVAQHQEQTQQSYSYSSGASVNRVPTPTQTLQTQQQRRLQQSQHNYYTPTASTKHAPTPKHPIQIQQEQLQQSQKDLSYSPTMINGEPAPAQPARTTHRANTPIVNEASVSSTLYLGPNNQNQSAIEHTISSSTNQTDAAPGANQPRQSPKVTSNQVLTSQLDQPAQPAQQGQSQTQRWTHAAASSYAPQAQGQTPTSTKRQTSGSHSKLQLQSQHKLTGSSRSNTKSKPAQETRKPMLYLPQYTPPTPKPPAISSPQPTPQQTVSSAPESTSSSAALPAPTTLQSTPSSTAQLTTSVASESIPSPVQLPISDTARQHTPTSAPVPTPTSIPQASKGRTKAARKPAAKPKSKLKSQTVLEADSQAEPQPKPIQTQQHESPPIPTSQAQFRVEHSQIGPQEAVGQPQHLQGPSFVSPNTERFEPIAKPGLHNTLMQEQHPPYWQNANTLQTESHAEKESGSEPEHAINHLHHTSGQVQVPQTQQQFEQTPFEPGPQSSTSGYQQHAHNSQAHQQHQAYQQQLAHQQQQVQHVLQQSQEPSRSEQSTYPMPRESAMPQQMAHPQAINVAQSRVQADQFPGEPVRQQPTSTQSVQQTYTRASLPQADTGGANNTAPPPAFQPDKEPVDQEVMEKHMRELVERMRYYQSKNPAAFSAVWDTVRKESTSKNAITAGGEAASQPQPSSIPSQLQSQIQAAHSSAHHSPPPPSQHQVTTINPNQLHTPPPTHRDSTQPSHQPTKPSSRSHRPTHHPPQEIPQPTKPTQLPQPFQQPAHLTRQEPRSQASMQTHPAAKPSTKLPTQLSVQTPTPLHTQAPIHQVPPPDLQTNSASTAQGEATSQGMSVIQKYAIATMASEHLTEETGKLLVPEAVMRLLEATTDFVSLCESFEKMGFVFDRGRFARSLLGVVHNQEKLQKASEELSKQARQLGFMQEGRILGEVREVPSQLEKPPVAPMISTAEEALPNDKISTGQRSRGRPRKNEQIPGQAPDSGKTVREKDNDILLTPTSEQRVVPGQFFTKLPQQNGAANPVIAPVTGTVTASRPPQFTPFGNSYNLPQSDHAQGTLINIEDSPSPPPPFTDMDIGNPLNEESPFNLHNAESNRLRKDTSQPSLLVKLPIESRITSSATPLSNAAARQSKQQETIDLTRPEVSSGPRNHGPSGWSGTTPRHPLAKQVSDNFPTKPAPPPPLPPPSKPQIPMAEPIKRKEARRISHYDPKDIARKILIIAGRHPTERALNSHLLPLRDNTAGIIDWHDDLSTVRWDILDPEPISIADTGMDGDDADEGNLMSRVTRREKNGASLSGSKKRGRPSDRITPSRMLPAGGLNNLHNTAMPSGDHNPIVIQSRSSSASRAAANQDSSLSSKKRRIEKNHGKDGVSISEIDYMSDQAADQPVTPVVRPTPRGYRFYQPSGTRPNQQNVTPGISPAEKGKAKKNSTAYAQALEKARALGAGIDGGKEEVGDLLATDDGQGVGAFVQRCVAVGYPQLKHRTA